MGCQGHPSPIPLWSFFAYGSSFFTYSSSFVAYNGIMCAWEPKLTVSKEAGERLGRGWKGLDQRLVCYGSEAVFGNPIDIP